MNIKTRHAYEKPIESDLEDYQLGWSIDEGCLYIKDPSQQGDKVLRVLSDKALLDANQKFIKELQDSLNSFSDGEIAKAKEELGWEAQYGIKEMCADSWRWQSQNPNGYEE